MEKVTANKASKVLRKLGNPDIAEHSQRFFKTGKGEYGEGDQFLGIRVPVLRRHVNHFQQMALDDVQNLLTSPYHEERLFSLLLLVQKFTRGNESDKLAIYQMYLDNTQYINNWDLVDSSADKIIGVYLVDKDSQVLYTLAQSNSLWERRIAIISTLHFIRNHKFDDTLHIAKQLINDPEDLIHKAVGWMLREVGKRDLEAEKAFLKSYYQTMPRTMLRYAIEKFPQHERKQFLDGSV